MERIIFSFLLIIGAVLLVVSCKDDDSFSKISVSTQPGALNFSPDAGTQSIEVTMTGKSWVASSSASWCQLSVSESSAKKTSLQVTVTANDAREARESTIVITVDGKESISLIVRQVVAEGVYPNYSFWKARENTGMSKNSFELASQMVAGWNLGNSLEVPGNETDWGNPKTTQAFIDQVKAAGINAVRLPCAWDSYVENTATLKLKASWLSRVKEVVDYCVNNDMYVVLNIHWDGGWLENNPTQVKQKLVNGKQRAFWEQIAMHFREYDEHLLFAGTNEVHVDGTPSDENFTVQMSFNKTFVDAVRSTGGKNSYRNLVVQAYNTNIDYAVSKLVVPSDSVANRLLVEVHYYDPWDFCGLETDASWATAKSFWGVGFAQYGEISNWGQEDHALAQFQKMKTHFVDEGYPVILGEYGAIRRPSSTPNFIHHLASRAYFLEFVTREAKNNGLVPFIWDNGSTGNYGMGLFNRNNGAISDSQAMTAFLSGATAGVYPF